MSTPTYLLCIETSTTNCSVAIAKEGQVIIKKEDNSAQYSHAESLHVFIKNILDEEQINLNQLSAVVISKGPGSYTGLRIGVSTAKGLCYALNIPLISINTLESLAHQVISTKEDLFIIPMLDARRMEVFTAIFDHKFNPIQETNALILEENSYFEFLNQKKCVFIGNGVAKFQEICLNPNAIFMTKQFPTATELGKIGFEKFQNKQFEDVAYFEPFYLKDFMVIKSKKKS